MKNKYSVIVDMWECPKNVLITETNSYNKAVEIASKLTQSPAVIEASVSLDSPTSLIARKVFTCSRDEWSFNAENIDGNFVYTTETGEVIHPPAEYYKLSEKLKRGY